MCGSVVDPLFYTKANLVPTNRRQLSSQSLRARGLTAAATDQFGDGNFDCAHDPVEFALGLREVFLEDGFRMIGE